LDLARYVIASTGRTFELGAASAWTFLIRTPESVEQGMRRLLERHFGGSIVAKERVTLLPTTLTLNPDLVFHHGAAIADIKYKIVGPGWKRPDLYQAVAFAEGFRATRAAVIEFDSEGAAPICDVTVGDIRLRHFCWSAGSDVAPSEAGERLGTAIGRWLDSSP
jgi:hypothetical protein